MLTGDNDWALLEYAPARPASLDATGHRPRRRMTGKGKAWFDDIHLIVDDGGGAGPAARASLGTPSDPAKEERPAAPRVPDDLVKLVQGRIVRASSLVKDAAIIAYLPDWHHNHVDWFAVCDGGFSGEGPLSQGGVRALLDWAHAFGRRHQESRAPVPARIHARRVPAQATGPVLIYPILEAWPENTSWRNQPGYADEPSSTVRLDPRWAGSSST